MQNGALSSGAHPSAPNRTLLPAARGHLEAHTIPSRTRPCCIILVVYAMVDLDIQLTIHRCVCPQVPLLLHLSVLYYPLLAAIFQAHATLPNTVNPSSALS